MEFDDRSEIFTWFNMAQNFLASLLNSGQFQMKNVLAAEMSSFYKNFFWMRRIKLVPKYVKLLQ